MSILNSNIFKQNLANCDSGEGGGLPYLGCSIRSLNDTEGMEIVLVNTESPAWHAGIKHGDIILEINSQKVNKI